MSSPEVTNENKPNRNQRRRQRTRDSIISAAEKVFRRKGVNDVTVNDLTEEADVAYGSFYNHFHAMDDVIAAVAENKIQSVADKVGEIITSNENVEILPFIGSRIMMRTLYQDPAFKWLLQRPYIFAAAFYKILRPFMLSAERGPVAQGIFRPAGDHETWIRIYPWILISELNKSLESGDLLGQEDRFALISMRMLGIDDSKAPTLLKESRELATAAGFPEPQATAARAAAKPRTKSGPAA